MADPESRSTALPADYLAVLREEFKRFYDYVENGLDAVYKLGLEHGDAAAISRILKAAKPSANGQVAAAASPPPRSPRATRSPQDKTPGAATHKLIEAVLRAAPTGKATPTEIAASTANKTNIARDAVRNALRRGRPAGRYVSDGKGRYSLGKAEAQK